jgi:hypothetical protein
VENLTEIRPEVCQQAAQQGLLSWIMKRLRAKLPFDANKLYCSEILSILLQGTPENRQLLGEIDGIDILLQQLAVRKRFSSFIFHSCKSASHFLNYFLADFQTARSQNRRRTRNDGEFVRLCLFQSDSRSQPRQISEGRGLATYEPHVAVLLKFPRSGLLPFILLILKPDPFFFPLSLQREKNVQKWLVKGFESRT